MSESTNRHPDPSPAPARLPRDRIVPTYTWIAPVHDVLAVLVESHARSMGLDWADVSDGERVLEVAVGTGLTFRRLLGSNPNGWTEGVDLTPAMLRRARRRVRKVPQNRYRLSIGDAYALTFPDRSFDLVLNSYMFDMLPIDDFSTVLREFMRVLKPTGRLVMVTMTSGRAWYNQVWEGIYRLHPPLLGGCRGVSVEPYLQEVGFVHTRRAYVSQWTFPSEVVYGERPA